MCGHSVNASAGIRETSYASKIERGGQWNDGGREKGMPHYTPDSIH